jgi:hypothetical protein
MPENANTGTPPNTDTPPAPPAGTPPPSPASAGDNQRNVMMPVKALRDRLQTAEKKGRSAAMAELDAAAQAKGFANHVAMMDHMEKVLASTRSNGQQQHRQAQNPNPTRTPGARPQPPANKHDRQAMQRYDADLVKWRREAEKAQQLARDADKRRRQAERRADAVQAEANLERIASRVGIKDTGYAIHLFKQAHMGKTKEELEKLDEVKFFEGLRQDHGYLFSEQVVPATTGTAGAPPIVPPGPAGGEQGRQGEVDVRRMSKSEYEAYLRKKGIAPSATGLG